MPMFLSFLRLGSVEALLSPRASWLPGAGRGRRQASEAPGGLLGLPRGGGGVGGLGWVGGVG